MIELLLATAWNFSVPEAPYSIDRREEGGAKAVATVSTEEIRVGNRKIRLNGSVLGVMANGTELVNITAWVDGSKNWSQAKDWKVSLLKDGRGVHRTCTVPGAQMKDGESVTIESDVRVMPNGEIELKIFNPGANPRRGSTAFNLYLPPTLFYDQMVSVNGSAPFRLPPNGHEFRKFGFPADAKMFGSRYDGKVKLAFLSPDGKTPRLTIRYGENCSGGGFQCGDPKHVGLDTRMSDPSKPLTMYFDFGDVRIPKEKPHLAGGVNFREENDFDVAVYDEKRNILVNGGMESGARYWKGSFRLSEDAHTGKYAMSARIGFDSYVQSVGTVLKPKTWYTAGLWVKVADGKPGTVGFGARGTTGYEGFLKDVRMPTKPTADWQFVSGSFETKASTSEVTFNVVADWKRMVIDDICLVEGSNAVATAVNPWGLELRTGAEDNLFVPADRKNGKIQLLVRGPKGAKAKLDISGSDLLARKTIAKTASVTIPAAGETLVDLGRDEEFPKGVNGIKVKLNPVCSTTTTPRIAPAAQLASLGGYSNYDSHPYTDYLRFNKAKWGDNRQKHRYMQTDWDGRGFVGGLERLGRERYERMAKRSVMLGMGVLNYTTTWLKPEFFSDEERAILDKYGIVDLYGGVRGNLSWKELLNGKPIEWNGTNYHHFVEYPADFLKWVEQQTYEQATNIPWRTYWTFDTEAAGHHDSLKKGRFDEYAKLMTAVNRGLKRANPKNEFCPYGTWNMGQGTAEIAAILSQLKRVDPETHYKYIEVHSYREFPEDPDVQKDLEAFFSRLSGAGYDDIQIKIGEGSYYFPMFRPSTGMYPWTGVTGHDGYSGIVIPGYDLGYGEKIGAAMTIRETAIYYRNDKRIFNNCSWNPRWIDLDTPCGWLLANTALLEMLGDATYLGEVRFAPMSRAMFFNDGHGALTVFMWRGDATFDKGQTGPVEAEIDFGDIKPEFYDLYANRCAPAIRQSNNRTITKLPLSGYPVYIKLPKEQIGKAKAFKRAIAETLVRADLNKLPLSCSLTLKDAATVEVKVVNTLSRTMKARVKVNGEDKGEVSFGGLKTVSFDVKLEKPIAADAYASVKVPVEFVYEGKTYADDYTTSAVTVGYVKGDQPDWSAVPAVDLATFSMWHNVGSHKSKKDFNGTIKLAWNEKHLWMRFNVNDDVFMAAKNAKDWKAWGSDSDMIHLFFDGYANGREKFKRGQTGYDFDDFAFGIFPVSEMLAKVVRTRAPDHQLTGGAGYGFVRGPEDHVQTQFAADGQGYELTLDFPAYYMMPVKLEAGGISPGFAAIVYDRDQNDYPPRKAVKNCEGAGPDEHPENWPQLIFVK